MGGLFFLVFLAVIVFIVSASINSRKRANQAWSRAAQKLGLLFQPPALLTPRLLHGSLDRHQVTVDTVKQRSGNSSTTYTRYKVKLRRPLGLGLRITHEGFFSGVTKLFGAQDVEVGDPAFDQKALVKADHPAEVARFLTPERRERIGRLLGVYPGLCIEDGLIECRQRGVSKSEREISYTVNSLCQLATLLTVEREADARAAAPAPPRQRARPGGKMGTVPVLRPRIPAAAVNGDSPHFPGPAEAETAGSTPPEPEPSARFRAGLDTSSERGEEREPQPAPPPPEPPLEVNAVCDALFAPGQMSFDSNRIFTERYEDRVVRWTGALRSIGTYSFDLVFGNTPGARAQVVLRRSDTGYGGAREIHAVVQLPREARDALAGRDGRPVAFEGRLAKVDTLMRCLYVRGGRVVDDAEA